MNPEAVPETERLVGQKVHHQFHVSEGQSSELRWFRGQVMSQVPGFPAWCNITYDDEPAKVYSYKLLDDVRAGDIELDEDIKCD